MKRNNFTMRIMSAIFALVLLLGSLGPIASLAAEEAWTVSDGTEIFWVNTSASEKNYVALSNQILRFSGDLAEKVTGTALAVSYGEIAEAGEEDIVLVLDSSADLDAQGYEITVSGNSITVTASDAAGLMYGCNSLIRQLLVYGDVTSETSAPYVLERGLSLDNGRKYYTVEWLKSMIRELAWNNMNTLVLHFSEEMGLGLESKLYPWLAGRDGTLCVGASIASDNRYLTQEEVADIVEYAHSYHVQIVPSFDSPGHMNYIVKKFNEKCEDADYSFTYDGKTYTAEAGSEIGNYYHYNGKTSIVQGSRNTDYSRGIDISNEVAVAFTKSLIKEFGTLFADLGCTAFDIGGDELLGWGGSLSSSVSKWKQLDHWKEYAQNRTGNSSAVGYDGFLLYMNDLYDLVSGMGYDSVRMWNDDAFRSADTGWTGVVNLNTNIDILYWTPTANSSKNNIWTYLNPGHKAFNYLNYYNYYVVGKLSQYPNATAKNIYNYWTPYMFATSSSGTTTSVGNPNVLGSAFCIWADTPNLATEETVMSDTLPMIRAHGAKAWDPYADDSVSYSTYSANVEKCGYAPQGNLADVEIYEPADLTDLEEAVAEFDSVDETLYTEDSYTAYASAVAAGEELLASAKPSQKAVDAAVEAIADAKAALVLKPTVDTAALEAAVAEFASVNADAYTEDSYAAYAAAVAAGQELLDSQEPAQDTVDAAVEAIAEARAALVLKPTVDTAALEAAVAEFASVDAAAYTEDSYAAYAAAVAAGQELLDSEEPAQEAVDAAVEAIAEAKAALVLLSVDTDALEAAIAEFEQVDSSLYTYMTFKEYTAAVEAAKELLDSGEYTQVQVDSARSEIEEAKQGLKTPEESCFISGTFKTSKVAVGKVANMIIHVTKDSEIVGFEVYNEAGTMMQLVRQTVSTKKADRDIWTIIFKATAEEVTEEPHNYKAYAVFDDGTRSSDYAEASIQVK